MAAENPLTPPLICLSPTIGVDILGRDAAWFPLENLASIEEVVRTGKRRRG